MRRLQISFFFIFFFFCLTSIVYSEELAATPSEELKSPAEAVKDSTETVKKHIESVKNLINEIKGKTEIFKKQADTVVQKKADVINSLADIIQSQVEIVKSEAAKFVEKIKKTSEASIETEIKNWNETIEGLKERTSAYNLQADKLKEDVDELKKALAGPGYDTQHFFIHTGAVTLNPYTVKRDTSDLKDAANPNSGKYKLSPAGASDTHVYVEALYRQRNAWLDKNCDKEWYVPCDYEAKIAYYGFKESKEGVESAVVSGTGDAGGEVSIGWDIKPLSASHLDIRHTLNLELTYGLITDRAALNVRNYYGAGIVSVWGVPFRTKTNNDVIPRKIEILAGLYYKSIQVPAFVNSSTREIKEENEYPKFIYKSALNLRLDTHLPIGENGFLTMAGQFYNIPNIEGEYPQIVNPWSVSFGITTPYDQFVKDVIGMINSFLKQ